jgi:hypothetical protein
MAVPIDIQSMDAVFSFDGATEAASANAIITYTVGPSAGNPIFDLRQVVTQACCHTVAPEKCLNLTPIFDFIHQTENIS